MPSLVKRAPEKRCVMCNVRFNRRRWRSGTLEDFTAYNKRQFCSLSCANSRSKGGLSRKAFHARARKLRKKNCECCGTTKRLHAHHVDENWMNNDPSNVQTLCIFCHQFWHATHRRLGVKPSMRMPKLFSLLFTEHRTELVGSVDMGMPWLRRKRRSL